MEPRVIFLLLVFIPKMSKTGKWRATDDMVDLVEPHHRWRHAEGFHLRRSEQRVERLSG